LLENQDKVQGLIIIFAPMRKYNHIFFDLDRTIWDFDAGAEDSFNRMFNKYDLKEKGVPSLVEFKARYDIHNDLLWSWYRKGEILKEVLNVKRFEMSLADFGIDDSGISSGMAEDYVIVNPDQAFLFPHAIESLEYLAPKYPLHLITNGFQEVQEQKFNIARLDRFFKTVTTSEEAGIKKPEPEIFHFAMNKAGSTAMESIIIGDDLAVDVVGARNVGMDQVYFNPEGSMHKEKVTFEIRGLEELMEIF
jgi:putative hydrolase of the HAD superfamily